MAAELFYFDLQQRERASAVGFLVKGLLDARSRLGLASNAPSFDEDVNIYLAHLLLALLEPAFRDLHHRYVSLRDSDVFALAHTRDESSHKYLIYRLNADHLLLTLSIFRRAETLEGETWHEGHGRAYYQFASDYATQLFRRSTGLSDVLRKLSDSFDQYRSILSETREEYFRVVTQLSDADCAAFLADAQRQHSRLAVAQLRDDFLDAYSGWMKSNAPTDRERVEQLARELTRLDPDFRFDRLPPA